jgi:hypothetical protein
MVRRFDCHFPTFGLGPGAERIDRDPAGGLLGDEEPDEEPGGNDEAEEDEGSADLPIGPRPQCCRGNCLAQVDDQEIRHRRAYLDSLDYSGRQVYYKAIIGFIGGAGVPGRQVTLLWKADVPVCRAAFLWLHQISERRVREVRAEFLREQPVMAQEHGLEGRQPNNRVQQHTARRAPIFLGRYVADKGMPSPGRDRRRNDGQEQHLPTSFTIKKVYADYQDGLGQGIHSLNDSLLISFRRGGS